jgi:hypothetical protein
MEQIPRLLLMILAFIVLLVLGAAFLFPQKGLLPKAANATTSFGDLLDQAIGASQTESVGVTISSEHKEAVKHLKEKIVEMRESGEDECFGYYKFKTGSNGGKNGLPPLGEDGTKIEFSVVNEGMGVRVFKGEEEGTQEYTFETIENVIPCVISGGSVPANFYNKIVNSGSNTNYHNSVENVVIKFDDSRLFDSNENRISYKGEFLDFEDGGFLFKKGKNICFFPTVDGGSCSGKSNVGLEAGCLGRGTVISNLISLRGLRC